MRASLLFAAALFLTACPSAEDNPTTVKDLRVLAIQFEPPEIMAPDCDALRSQTAENLQRLLAYAQPVRMRALLADPAGEGREISYDVRACAWTGDRKCESAADSVELKTLTGQPARGVITDGELVLDLLPGLVQLPTRKLSLPAPDGGTIEQDEPLLLQVFQQDSFKGLGGLRMPIVLHLEAGAEEIYAQKLMVFSCKLFPEMTANVNPVLPGLVLDDEPWVETPYRELRGPGPFKLFPDDFSALEEPYTVPSFELSPVRLEESWKLFWHGSYGQMSPGITGGTDPDGVTSRHNVEWTPPSDAAATQVTFYIVVRDGRGGTSWVTRTANYLP